MYNRIADELGGRSDLLSNSTGMSTPPIQLAILDAVKQWERERFYFNEIRQTAAFSTVNGQEFYTSSDWADIATMAHIDKLSILVSGNRYFLIGRTEQYMEDVSINPSVTGVPIEYGYYAEQLRFYPIPNGAYPVNVLGTKRQTALSAAGDTNAWTSDAEELIRLTAKRNLYRDTLMDDAGAARMERAMGLVPGIPGALQALQGETFRRSATNRIKPTFF